MHPSPEDVLAPQDEMAPNGVPHAERLSLRSPSRPASWTLVRQVRTRGGQYIESRHAAFGSHPSHTHETPTIALLLRGALEVRFASGRRLSCEAGAAGGALVLPPGPPHGGRAGADGARVLFLTPEPDRVAAMGAAAADVLAVPAWWRAPQLAALGRGISRELAVADDAAALALEGLTLELLAALVRRRGEAARPGPPPAWLRRVREALDDRYAERALRIADLAALAGVDPAHLARAFRAHYGTTAGAYLRETRVRRAAEALARSSAPLGQIALDAGFADQSHFTRVFRAIHGVTPKRWRALHTR
ncbi:MAG TPA: AraC family transcriptional regulator [Gemmatimonadaceae bacterium]